MRAQILAEGSVTWGMGHLYRCLGIANALKNRGYDVFWNAVGDGCAMEFLKKNQISGLFIDSWENIALDGIAERTKFVVVDSYHAPVEVYKKLSDRIKYNLWMDDDGRLDYPRGYVLNPNPRVSQLSLRNGVDGKFLLSGFSFQPLRSEFQNPCMRSYSESINRILVVMGGTDVRGLTPKIILAIRSVMPNVDVTAIVPRDDQRQCWGECLGSACRLLASQTALQMRELMENSDLAISAGGQTIMELVRLGVPTLAIEVADNQHSQLVSLDDAKVIRIVGSHDMEGLEVRLEEAIISMKSYEARRKLAKDGPNLIDGRGIERALIKMGAI